MKLRAHHNVIDLAEERLARRQPREPVPVILPNFASVRFTPCEIALRRQGERHQRLRAKGVRRSAVECPPERR